MVIPPFRAPLNFKDALHPKQEGETYWFIFYKDQLLVSHDKKNLPSDHRFVLQRSLYMGALREKLFYVGEIENQNETPNGWIWSDLRGLFGSLDEDLLALAGRALQLIDWDRNNAYCGTCGNLTTLLEKERARKCTKCARLFYPKIAPAIMALIMKKDKMLLARSPHFPEKMYSVIAGFVDPGETLEQCLAREVFEEVGLLVKNVRYFGSQPWPFSRSLMIGFICDWQAGEIQIDPSEIEDAAWFDRDSLPQLPSLLSLSRMLIDSQLIVLNASR